MSDKPEDTSKYTKDLEFGANNFSQKAAENLDKKTKENIDKLDVVAISQLEQVMFMADMHKKREELIQKETKEYKELLKNSGSSYLEKKRSMKLFQENLFKDKYSVEKGMIAKYEEELERLDSLNKQSKKASKLTSDELQQILKDKKELEAKVGNGLDSYIMEQSMKGDYDKFVNKFPEIAKSLNDEITGNINQEITLSEEQLSSKHSLAVRADAITKSFNDRYPSSSKEMADKYRKEKKDTPEKTALQTGLSILSTASKIYNPIPALAIAGITKILETDVMQKVKKDITSSISTSLDRVGIKEGTKLRTALKATTIGVVGLGAALLYASDGDLDKAFEAAKGTMEQIPAVLERGLETASNYDFTGVNGVGVDSLNASAGTDLNDKLSKIVENASSEPSHSDLTPKGVEAMNNIVDKVMDGMDGMDSIPLDTAGQEQIVASNTANVGEILKEIEGAAAETIPLEATMQEIKVLKGDTLSGMLEKIDGVAYDLNGQNMNQAVALIAEMNGITDPNNIEAGMSLKLPENTEALKALMENNADKLAGLDTSWATKTVEILPEVGLSDTTVALKEVVTFTSPEIELLGQEIVSLTSPEVRAELISTEVLADNKNLESILEDYRHSDDVREGISNSVNENIQKQIAEGTFPKDIVLEFSSENSSYKESLSISKESLQAGGLSIDSSIQDKVTLVQDLTESGIAVQSLEEGALEMPNAKVEESVIAQNNNVTSKKLKI
jgi:hypothetical protein